MPASNGVAAAVTVAPETEPEPEAAAAAVAAVAAPTPVASTETVPLDTAVAVAVALVPSRTPRAASANSDDTGSAATGAWDTAAASPATAGTELPAMDEE